MVKQKHCHRFCFLFVKNLEPFVYKVAQHLLRWLWCCYSVSSTHTVRVLTTHWFFHLALSQENKSNVNPRPAPAHHVCHSLSQSCCFLNAQIYLLDNFSANAIVPSTLPTSLATDTSCGSLWMQAFNLYCGKKNPCYLGQFDAALFSALWFALVHGGVDVSVNSGHSFRVEAATTATQQGLRIKMLDHWESSAYSYVRMLQESLAAITRQVVD